MQFKKLKNMLIKLYRKSKINLIVSKDCFNDMIRK